MTGRITSKPCQNCHPPQLKDVAVLEALFHGEARRGKENQVVIRPQTRNIFVGGSLTKVYWLGTMIFTIPWQVHTCRGSGGKC